VNLGGSPAVHLTYCTNIHAGESWAEVRATLETHVPEVRRQLGRNGAFGIGLRLSGRAATELGLGEELDRLRAWLDDEGLYVFTINGFPHGKFHGARVKENVYRPDWLEDERLTYSDLLANQLARLLPRDGGIIGSVSTVPGAFRPRVHSGDETRAMALRIAQHAATLHSLESENGTTITLALEPEPHCHMETIAETISFLDTELLSTDALELFTRRTGLAKPAAERFLRDHVGICLDTCHAAVEFEDHATCIANIDRAGFKVFKMQLSAGLNIDGLDENTAAALERWHDDVYLHQVVARSGDRLQRYADLPEALAAYRAHPEVKQDWRVHFHVPLFRRELGAFVNTQDFLDSMLALQHHTPFTTHLEVETYTWDVLPKEFRAATVDEDIARELAWVLERLES
jgi:sugar phosphate isomerase/epimerase